MTNVIGPDVSFWQDDNNTPQGINFVQMRDAGASFVILRAGQGAWIDPDFARGYAAAKAAGLPRGVYWYFDSRYSPLSQALLCASAVGQDFPELGVWLDLEESYGGGYRGWQNWIQCLAALKTKFPRVGCYTAPFYWMLNRPQDAESLAYFKSFDLWLAHYNVTTPLVPSPWTSWVLWQYGTPAEGLKYGAESLEIDMNYFNGDINTFHNYFDIVNIPEKPGGIMQIIKGKALGTVRRRDAPAGMPFIPERYLMVNDEIEASENSAQWLHLSKINGVSIEGEEWVSAGSTQQYIQWGWVTVSDPPAEPADTITVNVEATITATINGRVYTGVANIEGLELA
jgi:GH25 family lysozyme M1 (1,4-beta-N-acetylmuramidase)